MRNKLTIARDMAVTYKKALGVLKVESEKIDDHTLTTTKYYRLRHIAWMCDEVLKIAKQGNITKAFLWLGFVQGVMWAYDARTVDECRKDNTP